MREIKVVIDEGGLFQEVFVSPELRDCSLEVLDFCTDDPHELDRIQAEYEECLHRTIKNELVPLWDSSQG